MSATTYTLLVTIAGPQPVHEKALADRIRHHLEVGTNDFVSFEAATVDAIEGDHLAHEEGKVARISVLHYCVRHPG